MRKKGAQAEAPGQYEEVQLSGKVTKQPYAIGSKSERMAILLHTADEDYVLRRRGGNPFHDPELEKLVGKQISCSGVLTNHTLIISHWDEVESS
jgi:hypothetical protein